MHKLVENGGSVNSDTKVTFKFQRGLVSRKMALPQQKMAIRLREIANVLDREVEVRPNILDDVQEFITKFPMAEVPTCLEDNISRLPPEVLEHILHFLPPQDLKAIFGQVVFTGAATKFSRIGAGTLVSELTDPPFSTGLCTP